MYFAPNVFSGWRSIQKVNRVGPWGALRSLGPARIVVSVALMAALLWPMLRTPPVDSFPLSNYPMFSAPRGLTSTVSVAVGIDAEGTSVTLSPESIAGSDQVIHAARAVIAAIRADSANALCREVAGRVAGSSSPAVGIEIVTEEFDSIAWFEGDRVPESRQVHAECPVPR